MRQILLRSQDVILASGGSDGLFTTEVIFKSDMNKVLNTIDL